MKTNFFEHIAGLGFNGNLRINIHQEETGMQTVSVLLLKGNAATTTSGIPPLVFKGTAKELDEAFFGQLAEPVKQTTGLLNNVEAYQKELDKARKQATKDKGNDKTATATTSDEADDDDDQENESDLFTSQPDSKQAKAEKKKLFDEEMAKVKELAKQMKYTEALAQLPDVEEYADHADLIEAKREEINAGKDLYERLQQQFKD